MKTVVLWAPPVLLATWSGSYLLSCYRTLEAPGVPIRYVYETPGGALTFRADSYTFSLEQGTLRVNRPQLVDPDGALLARLERADISGIRTLFGQQKALKVKLTDLDARLVRLESGKLEFERYLPPKTESEGGVPFEVEIDGVRILAQDRRGARPFSQELISDRVQFAGVGDDWIGGGTLIAPSIGTMAISAQQIQGEGIHLAAKSSRLELAPLVNHLVTTGDLPEGDLGKLRVESLVALGPLRVFLPETQASEAEARLTLKVRGAALGTYHADSATFRGLLRESGAQGSLTVTEGGVGAEFRGSVVAKSGKPRLAGQLVASVTRPNAIPRWAGLVLPKGLDFSGARYVGWVEGESAKVYHARGSVSADHLRYGQDVVSSPLVRLDAQPGQIGLEIQSGTYRGEPVAGIVNLNPESGEVKGGLEIDGLPLAKVATRAGVSGLGGIARVGVTLTGTLRQPKVSLVATGKARFRQDGKPHDLGDFEIDASWQNNTLNLRRGVLRGPAGLLAANGSIGSGLGIGVVGRQLRPSAFLPDLGGEVNLIAQVGGTLQKPRIQGYAEAYNIRFADQLIPAVRTDLVADRKQVTLSGVRATSGTADLTGRASVALKSRRLSGAFRLKGLQIADFAREEDGLAGVIDVPLAMLTGSLDQPKLQMEVKGDSLVVRGAKVDALQAEITATKDLISLDASQVNVAEGVVSVAGKYAIGTRLGDFNVVAKDVALDPLARQISQDLTLDGALNGTASATVGPSGLLSLNGKGSLAAVRVNGTLIGDGPWSVERQGAGFLTDVHVGTIDSYAEVEKGYFDPYRKQMKGNLWLHGLAVNDLVAMGDRYLADLSFENRQSLRTLKGSLDLGAEFGGTTQRPEVNIDSFQLQDLNYREVKLGTFTANGKSVGSVVTLGEAKLEGPLGQLLASGTADSNGDIDMTLDVNNLNLTELGRAIPGAGAVGGRLEELSMVIRGATKSPRIRASAKFDDLLSKPGQPGMSVLLSTIRVNETDGIDVQGNVTYRGFTGSLEANAPFSYQGGIPNDKTVSAELKLPERSLATVADYIPSLDQARSKLGNVSGKLSVQGLINSLNYSGRVDIAADRLALLAPSTLPIGKPSEASPIRDTIDAFTASVSFDNGLLRVGTSGRSSRQGSFDVEASTPLGQLGRLADSLGEGGASALLESPLSGTVSFENFSLRQPFAGNSYVAGTVDGQIDIRGTLASPLISTAQPLQLLGIDSIVPMFETKPGASDPPAVDPRFDVRFAILDPARIRTTAAELFLTGDGQFRGSLTSPELKSQLQVESGTLALPGGRVRLEQGGLVDVSLQPGEYGPVASAVVDMEGSTSLTALRSGSTYERYTINLSVNGDLLKEGGLNLNATSDPADLSRDRILALLGQTDLLEAIGNDLGSSDTEKRIRNALVGYALPSLADPITNRFARGLGLDYLSIEYNPLEETSVALAKSLSNGFFLQGRRQISDPPPGFKLQYDLRLVYRPRRVRGALSRISFSLGADQDTAIKFAIDYGVRF